MKKNWIITVLAILLFLAVAYIVFINQTATFCIDQVESEENSQTDNTEDTRSGDLDSEPEEGDGAENIASQNSQNDLKENIIGSWRDAQNEQSITSFEASGTFRFVYSGGAIQESGTYQIFADASVVPEEMPNISGPVLIQTIGDNHSYYEIIEITEDIMILLDSNEGQTQVFKKIN